jgi:hypothetical protein
MTAVMRPARGATQGVGHDNHFHEVVIGRAAGGLHDEHILATHVLVDFD